MQGCHVGGVGSSFHERAKKSRVGIATNRVPITSVLWEGITSNFYFTLQAFFWREKEGGHLKMKSTDVLTFILTGVGLENAYEI